MKCKFMIFITVFLMFVLAGIPVITEGLTFEGNVNIEIGSGDQEEFDIASWGTGDTAEVYITYEDHSFGLVTPHVMFKRSVNGGASFGSPVDMLVDPDSDDKQLSPALDVMDDGTGRFLILAYLDNSPGETSIDYYLTVVNSTDGGATWSSPVMVTGDHLTGYPNNKMRDVDISIDHRGNIFLVWTEGSRIRMSCSTDRGNTWTVPRVVSEFQSADNGDHIQKHPTIASDGRFVTVVFESDPNHRQYEVFSTYAEAPDLDETLIFSEPDMVPESRWPTYSTFWPRSVAVENITYLVWWDFSTDSNGNDNLDMKKDRPAIMFTRSINGGRTWGVGTERSVKVNFTTEPTAWHSRADINVGPSGEIAVTWIDLTGGYMDIFVSTSDDGGDSFSEQFRCNDHTMRSDGIPPVVSIDSGGGIHTLWGRTDGDSGCNMFYSRTVEDRPPEPVEDLKTIFVDEYEGEISWTFNSEPDFDRYRIYLDTNSDFIPGDDNLYNESTVQEMRREVFKDLEPDTDHYVRIEVLDRGNNSAISDEITFRTLPINQPPVFMKNISTIHMEEDRPLYNALNLSEWVEEGWLIDDGYGGQTELEFEIVPLSGEPKVNPVFRDRNFSQPFWIMDIFPGQANWAGTEMFRILARDQGKDGGFGTPDDRFTFSDPFNVTVDPTNDHPSWIAYQDLKTDAQILLGPSDEELILKATDTGCIERQNYGFAIVGFDIDGDFITYTASDPRIDIERDLVKPDIKSTFTFTPDNEDVPRMNFTITADDGKGGTREIRVFLPVENVNDPPVISTVNGEPVPADMTGLSLSMTEEEEVSFTVSGTDIDHGDMLDLDSMFDRIRIQKTGESSWNVSFRSEEGDHLVSPVVFDLNLYDRAREMDVLTIEIDVKDRQNPPRWSDGVLPIEIEFVYDIVDPNEEKDVNKFGGARIQAEWNEMVTFTGYAEDLDNDPLAYRWRIEDLNGTVIATYEGGEVDHSFSPSLKSLEQEEKFVIVLNVTDGNFPGIEYTREIFVRPDIDNDNDGMIDDLEIRYFGSLERGPQGDMDGDGIPDGVEIGVDTPEHTDPTYDENTVPLPPDNSTSSKDLPTWIPVTVGIVTVILIAMLIGFLVIIRVSRIKERKEDEDIEVRVRNMENRQREITSLYGGIDQADEFGPDQSTLEDLQLDMGGQVYHEEGSSSIGGVRKGRMNANDGPSGPHWESGSGPVFEDSAPGLSFGDSLELREGPPVDEEVSGEALDRSMSELMED